MANVWRKYLAGNVARILNLKESEKDGNPRSMVIPRNKLVAVLTSGDSNLPCPRDEGCLREDKMSSLRARCYRQGTIRPSSSKHRYVSSSLMGKWRLDTFHFTVRDKHVEGIMPA